MTTDSLSPNGLAGATKVAVKLPADVAGMLQKEARARRKTVGELVRDWLQDNADAREAERRWKAHEAGKTQAIPAGEVYKRLGI